MDHNIVNSLVIVDFITMSFLLGFTDIGNSIAEYSDSSYLKGRTW